MDGTKVRVIPFTCAVNPFTGNCGIKCIHHIQFGDHDITNTQGKKQWRERCLEILEGFLYHACNAGIVVGSDSIGGDTLTTITKYGKDYMFSEKVWNPNYTWNKNHKVQIFSKILVNRKYPENPWTKLPIRFEK